MKFVGDFSETVMDFYGLPMELKRESLIVPLTGVSLRQYNESVKWLKEEKVKSSFLIGNRKEPILKVGDVWQEDNGRYNIYVYLFNYSPEHDVEYGGFNEVNLEDNGLVMTINGTDMFKEFSTLKRYVKQEKANPTVVLTYDHWDPVRIPVKGLVDTGYKDYDGNIIYETSRLTYIYEVEYDTLDLPDDPFSIIKIDGKYFLKAAYEKDKVFPIEMAANEDGLLSPVAVYQTLPAIQTN